jgi:hypothetical protein
MTPKFIYDNESTITLKEIIKSIICKKIDTLIKQNYDDIKVDSTDSSDKSKGEEVA